MQGRRDIVRTWLCWGSTWRSRRVKGEYKIVTVQCWLVFSYDCCAFCEPWWCSYTIRQYSFLAVLIILSAYRMWNYLKPPSTPYSDLPRFVLLCHATPRHVLLCLLELILCCINTQLSTQYTLYCQYSSSISSPFSLIPSSFCLLPLSIYLSVFNPYILLYSSIDDARLATRALAILHAIHEKYPAVKYTEFYSDSLNDLYMNTREVRGLNN